jgi:protein-L-isoaspartate(D-aspartate) O-methyltransferase
MAEILAQILSRGGELPPASRRVLEAMARVPRHEFVPPDKRLQAYDVRTPLSIAENQTISSPECVAIMTAALRLEGGEKVLEIGTGSGYQAAILGELAAQVYSIEIRPGLAESARKRLQELKAAGAIDHRKLEVVVGNGYQGYEAAAPFDAIIVTAAPREVPVELLNQLAPGGRMVIPVGDFYQRLQVIERRADGSLTHSVNETVRFVPMVGEDEVR